MTNPVPTPAERMPSRDRVREALRSLPRPGALDEAIVTDIAQDYVDGLLIEARAALASQPAAESQREALDVERLVAGAMSFQQTGIEWVALTPEGQDWWLGEARRFIAAYRDAKGTP